MAAFGTVGQFGEVKVKPLSVPASIGSAYKSFGDIKKNKPKNEEGLKKVVRNVKNLPEHLIGRFKHGKEDGKKPKE